MPQSHVDSLLGRRPVVVPRLALQAGLEHALAQGLNKPADLALVALRALQGAGYAVRRRPSGADFEFLIRGARVFDASTARYGIVESPPHRSGLERGLVPVAFETGIESLDPERLSVVDLAPVVRPWIE